MKNIYLYLLCILSLFTACKKDNITTTEVKPVDFSVSLNYDLSSSDFSLPLDNILVSVKNVNTLDTRIGYTNAEGKISFPQLPPGTYDVSAKATWADTTYYRLTGVLQDDSVSYQALSKSLRIVSGASNNLDMNLLTGRLSPWVFKQLYFAGSHRVNGALYRDQFIEIYNNSDSVLYADSLCIAQSYGRQSTATTTTYSFLTNGQYDWSKSLNMPSNIDANGDYVYTRSIIRIPGTGKTYPVQPGESILIAQTAINHKSPFTGTDGKTITVRDPSLTVDLSGANFEAHYASFLTRPAAADIDNPNVPNVDVIQYYGTDWILDNLGRDSYILFKADSTLDLASWNKYPLPSVAAPSSTATRYFQIPVSKVWDAVEIQPTTPDDRIPKRLRANLDAGFTYVPAGGYTSQSVIRKTARTVNSRRILKDSNNSTEDFTFLNIATPKGFAD